MGDYLRDQVALGDCHEHIYKASAAVNGCANYLVFNNYYTIEQVKLAKAQTCKKHMLCPFCARRRASKMLEKNLPKFEVASKPHLIPVLLTLTVKNGLDLTERFNHLKKGVQTLLSRRRQYLANGRGFNEFCKVDGAMFSYEITHNPESGWHPHVHMVALLDDYIDVRKLSDLWRDVTGDSFIVDVRKLRTSDIGKDSGSIVDAMQEVFKYALKFSDLSLDRQFEAWETLRTKRLTGSFGSLWGLEIPDDLLDDLSHLDDLPFIEMVYRFKRQNKAYDLLQSREREPTGGREAEQLTAEPWRFHGINSQVPIEHLTPE
jgi:plasmid rolling circle replication initiator protein Rep